MALSFSSPVRREESAFHKRLGKGAEMLAHGLRVDAALAADLLGYAISRNSLLEKCQHPHSCWIQVKHLAGFDVENNATVRCIDTPEPIWQESHSTFVRDAFCRIRADHPARPDCGLPEALKNVRESELDQNQNFGSEDGRVTFRESFPKS